MPEFLDMIFFDLDGNCLARASSRGFSVPPPDMLWKDMMNAPQSDKNAKGPVYYGVTFKVLAGQEEKINRLTLKIESDVNYFGKYFAMPSIKDLKGLLVGLYMMPIQSPEPENKQAIKALQKIAKEIVMKNREKLDRVLAFGCIPPYDMEVTMGSIKF